jgi:hypothetical protein
VVQACGAPRVVYTAVLGPKLSVANWPIVLLHKSKRAQKKLSGWTFLRHILGDFEKNGQKGAEF